MVDNLNESPRLHLSGGNLVASLSENRCRIYPAGNLGVSPSYKSGVEKEFSVSPAKCEALASHYGFFVVSSRGIARCRGDLIKSLSSPLPKGENQEDCHAEFMLGQSRTVRNDMPFHVMKRDLNDIV